MRLKKVKNADILIKKSSYLVEEPEKYKGNWNKLFGNDNPIEIEIGMGKGDFIISKAIDNPNVNYIGIEKYDSVLLRATEKLYETQIPNLRLILLDAIELLSIFDKEISMIYLNFSDPWPKKRHTKRRLTSDKFLSVYAPLFKEDIHIKQKTDNDSLYEYSLESFKENGFNIIETSTDYGKNKENTHKTEYEKKFISIGKNINYIYAFKEK